MEESPEPEKKYGYSECKAEKRNKRGKMMACGLLCHRHDEHDKGDCKRQKHIRAEETVKEAWKDLKFNVGLKVQKDDVTDDERDTRLTPDEEDILKRAHDISERKREESKRLTEQWTEQENKLKRKKEQRGTRERKMREVSNPGSSSEDQRSRRTQKDRGKPRINMIRVTPPKEVVLTPASEWHDAE